MRTRLWLRVATPTVRLPEEIQLVFHEFSSLRT
jgi:hypothetical protein